MSAITEGSGGVQKPTPPPASTKPQLPPRISKLGEKTTNIVGRRLPHISGRKLPPPPLRAASRPPNRPPPSTPSKPPQRPPPPTPAPSKLRKQYPMPDETPPTPEQSESATRKLPSTSMFHSVSKGQLLSGEKEKAKVGKSARKMLRAVQNAFGQKKAGGLSRKKVIATVRRSIQTRIPGVKSIKTTRLNPPDDIHQQEIYDTPDGKGAMGRVETTSKTDAHQLHGPRNDDNVSVTMLQGGGSVIVETDGAGSGGRGSAVLSHELNKNINAALAKHAKKLTALAKSGDAKALEAEVKEIAREALSKAEEKVRSDKSVENADRAATTLSVVMTVKISEGETMSFGLQNHDSVSLLWNPTTGKFDEKSIHTHETSKSQIKVGVSDNIEGSEFFSSTFTGERLAIAFSDGVLDNLPGAPKNIEVLNDIIHNPIFDAPVDTDTHPPGYALTAEQIKKMGDGNRTPSHEVTPQMVRNRILNFSFWASSDVREKQGAIDPYEVMKTDGVERGKDKGPLLADIEMKFQVDQEIDEKVKATLPESVQKLLKKSDEGKYQFDLTQQIDSKVVQMLHPIVQNQLKALGRGKFEFRDPTSLTLAVNVLPKNIYESEFVDQFKESVPVITYSQENAPEAIMDKFNETYERRGIENEGDDIVLIFSETVHDKIGGNFERKELEKAQSKDPEAITPKTDGVSVVVARVG